NTTVAGLDQKAPGWTLELVTKDGKSLAEHSAVIYCGTAFKLAELKVKVAKKTSTTLISALSHPTGNYGHGSDGAHEETCPADVLDLAALSGIRYPPVASVVLGFRREDVAHACEGFGMLIPKVEGFKILGTIFSSSLFPNRAPAGHLTLTSYVGGERYPEL